MKALDEVKTPQGYCGVFKGKFKVSGYMKKEVNEQSIFHPKGHLKRFFVINFSDGVLVIKHEEHDL
tara:strand:- start:3149 stop:3346 length:198 start_codon:yes stop_codon:yes gene_type:complete